MRGYHCIVLYCPLQYLYHLGVVHCVEKAFKVYVHCVVVALADYSACFDQCTMRSSPRAEAIAPVAELTFIDWCQHLGYRLLYHSVHHRGNAQLTFLAIVLGYFYPADGVRTICPSANTLFQSLAMPYEIAEQAFATHPVYSCRSAVALHLKISRV